MPVPATAGSVWARLGATVMTRLGAIIRARQTRHLLMEMEPRLLADIGIGRGDALHEANRPFWDVDTRA
jgi:uncharacterized protein YjiS (DUF1127 family)